jgi:HD superfamily phosphodiesterase
MHKKFDHAELSARTAKKLGYSERVVNAIREHSAGKGPKPTTLESRILWDSDKLDAFCAAGLARWFVMSGQSNYTAKQGAENFVKVTETIGIRPCSQWDLKDVLSAWFYTPTGKRMARKDMEYTIGFLKRVIE